LALAYDGIRLSGVSNRLFPSERAVCGLNSSKCFENQVSETRTLLRRISDRTKKSHINRRRKHEQIREETGSKYRLV
jgi:hypothetical protein